MVDSISPDPINTQAEEPVIETMFIRMDDDIEDDAGATEIRSAPRFLGIELEAAHKASLR